jgi:hypothetical protein
MSHGEQVGKRLRTLYLRGLCCLETNLQVPILPDLLSLANGFFYEYAHQGPFLSNVSLAARPRVILTLCH